jgi:hypothetical protein
METALRLAFGLLALLHVTPAAVFFSPALTAKLYGVDPSGSAGVLLSHRGALFVAVAAAAFMATFSPESRRLALVVISISMLGFLLTYLRAEAPAGPLRSIAVADLAGLVPLAFAWWAVHRGPS